MSTNSNPVRGGAGLPPSKPSDNSAQSHNLSSMPDELTSKIVGWLAPKEAALLTVNRQFNAQTPNDFYSERSLSNKLFIEFLVTNLTILNPVKFRQEIDQLKQISATMDIGAGLDGPAAASAHPHSSSSPTATSSPPQQSNVKSMVNQLASKQAEMNSLLSHLNLDIDTFCFLAAALQTTRTPIAFGRLLLNCINCKIALMSEPEQIAFKQEFFKKLVSFDTGEFLSLFLETTVLEPNEPNPYLKFNRFSQLISIVANTCARFFREDGADKEHQIKKALTSMLKAIAVRKRFDNEQHSAICDFLDILIGNADLDRNQIFDYIVVPLITKVPDTPETYHPLSYLIARAYLSHGNIDLASRAASLSPSDRIKNQVLEALCRDYLHPLRNQPDAALALADYTTDDQSRAKILELVCCYYHDQRDTDTAFNIAKLIPRSQSICRDQNLDAICDCYLYYGRPDLATEAALEIPVTSEYSSLGKVCKYYANRGAVSRSIATALLPAEDQDKLIVLREIVQFYAVNNNYTKEQILDLISEEATKQGFARLMRDI